MVIANVCRLLLAAMVASVASTAMASPYTMSYSGRVTDATGKPVSGEVEFKLQFFRAATGGVALPVTLANVEVDLSDGMFQIPIALSAADFNTVFNGIDPTWIQITDVTHSRVLPRQAFGAVPYALKVPIDDNVFKYDANGSLTLKEDLVPDRVLGTDLAGALTWVNLSGSGLGDMLSGTWDSNSNSKVDDADHATAADDATTLGGQAAAFYTDAANIPETATRKWLSDTERTKLAGVTAGADMLKSTYDTNADGKVNTAATADNATQLNGQAASYYLNADNIGSGTLADARIDAAIARDSELPTAASIATGFAADAISGNKVDGGTISNFASTGIDDNADALAITIDSSERVGVGTAAPTTKIHAFTSGSTNTILSETDSGTSNGSFQSKNPDRTWTMGVRGDVSDGFGIADTTAGSIRLLIDSSGNVGIGTSAPLYNLHVTGNGLFTSDVRTNANFYMASNNAYVGWGAGNNYIPAYSGTPTGVLNSANSQYFNIDSANASPGTTAFVFAKGSTNIAGTELMRVSENGNVGIGTASPSSTLDVNGAVTQRGMTAPAVSAAGQGRIYFDSGSNKFKASQNGGAYTDLIPATTTKVFSARITNNGTTCAASYQTGSWVSSVARPGVGNCTLTITGFSSGPACTCTGNVETSGYNTLCGFTAAPTTTTVAVTTEYGGAVQLDTSFDVVCVGM